MNTKRLRAIIHRYGTPGLLFVGLYLLGFSLWHHHRRALGIVALSLFLVPGFLLGLRERQPVAPPPLNAPLYTCRRAGGDDAGHNAVPKTVAQALDQVWGEARKTPDVRQSLRDLVAAVDQRNLSRAIQLGDSLFHLYQPPPLKMILPPDGNWDFHTGLGEVYLDQAWPQAAIQEFMTVLKAVPPATNGWGRSSARERSAYGMAYANALLGKYKEALQWLEQAPQEYRSGCGNCEAAKEVWNYPIQQVWQAAQLPFNQAFDHLLRMTAGQFDPLENWLAFSTPEEQKEHAAVEAAVTLGCLYLQHGDRTTAQRLFQKAAPIKPDLYQASRMAQGALAHLSEQTGSKM